MDYAIIRLCQSFCVFSPLTASYFANRAGVFEIQAAIGFIPFPNVMEIKWHILEGCVMHHGKCQVRIHFC